MMRGRTSRRSLPGWLTGALAVFLALGGVACDSYDDDGAGQPDGDQQEQPEGDGGY